MAEQNQTLMAYQEAVQKIKKAILQSRYRSASNANIEMISLYYSIGEYISSNSRSGKWGTGAIETISDFLEGEIPRLRGFSPSNMKNMRMFYEQWSPELNRQSVTGDLESATISSEIAPIRQLPTGELDENKISAFCRVGFTHHVEILTKCKSVEERWYYILRCADEFWSVASLKNHIQVADYKSFGSIPNNFTLTIPDARTAAIAVRSFRDDYLLDFVDIK